jgi:hypothetical protein
MLCVLRLVAVLAVTVAVATGSFSASALPGRADSCTASTTKTLVHTFVAAYDKGRVAAINSMWAPEPYFQWFSTRAPGRRLGAQAYNRLLSGGIPVKSWAAARGWLRVRMASVQPSPWTDVGADLKISRTGGFVWRDGSVFRIPLRLARLARSGTSLATP